MNEGHQPGEAASTVPLPQLIARSAQIETSDVGERVVLYHRVSGKSLVLNPTGSWLWRQLTVPLSAADLAARLRQQFPTLDETTAQRDVEAYLRALSEHDALLQTA